MRKLLDAAAKEFGEFGFHTTSVSGITRRAGTALGSYYTYFDIKEAVFSSLVRDMSESVAAAVSAQVPADVIGIAWERLALAAFLRFPENTKKSSASLTRLSSRIPPAIALIIKGLRPVLQRASNKTSPRVQCPRAITKSVHGPSWA